MLTVPYFCSSRASTECKQSSDDQTHPGDITLFCENTFSPTAVPCVAGYAHAHVIPSVAFTSALSFIFFVSLLLSVSLVVDDPLSVSDCPSLPAGLISDQRPVSISYVCWYRMQSLSFYDILQSNEVTEN